MQQYFQLFQESLIIARRKYLFTDAGCKQGWKVKVANKKICPECELGIKIYFITSLKNNTS